MITGKYLCCSTKNAGSNTQNERPGISGSVPLTHLYKIELECWDLNRL